MLKFAEKLSDCQLSWLVCWFLSVCQVFNLTGGALSFLLILLCLTLLFQWLFHCVLILNDTPLSICINSKKTHSFTPFLFAYHLSNVNTFNFRTHVIVKYLFGVFRVLKSEIGLVSPFKGFQACLLAQILDSIREGSCPVISVVFITIYLWGPLCIPARILCVL